MDWKWVSERNDNHWTLLARYSSNNHKANDIIYRLEICTPAVRCQLNVQKVKHDIKEHSIEVAVPKISVHFSITHTWSHVFFHLELKGIKSRAEGSVNRCVMRSSGEVLSSSRLDTGWFVWSTANNKGVLVWVGFASPTYLSSYIRRWHASQMYAFWNNSPNVELLAYLILQARVNYAMWTIPMSHFWGVESQRRKRERVKTTDRRISQRPKESGTWQQILFHWWTHWHMTFNFRRPTSALIDCLWW